MRSRYFGSWAKERREAAHMTKAHDIPILMAPLMRIPPEDNNIYAKIYNTLA
jgi:hypothetical protein